MTEELNNNYCVIMAGGMQPTSRQAPCCDKSVHKARWQR